MGQQGRTAPGRSFVTLLCSEKSPATRPGNPPPITANVRIAPSSQMARNVFGSVHQKKEMCDSSNCSFAAISADLRP